MPSRGCHPPASPPLSIAVLLLTLSAIFSTLAGWAPAVVLLTMLALLAIDVVISLVEARLVPACGIALLLAPAYVIWKG